MARRVLKAIPKDIESIIELNTQFKNAFKAKGKRFPLPKYYDKNWIEGELNEGNQYVLKKGSIVVGSMYFYTKGAPKGEAYVESIAIHPEDQREGLGRQLIDFAKRKAKKEGKEKLCVDSFCLFDVVDFYKKCGFTLDERLGDIKGFKYHRFSLNL